VKPVQQITDRAKRYRANRNRPAGKKRCNFCASRKNIDVDHISGDESDGEPSNLMYLCRSCNTRKAITQARNRIGTRTRQFNPFITIPSFQQFKDAAQVLIGVKPGDAAKATATVQAAPPEKREQFADKIDAANPFQSDAQRRKFFAMAGRGEISQATLKKFMRDNPAAPTFAQYVHGVIEHKRGAKDEGGKIIHATPRALRSQYAEKIADIKRQRRGEVPF
jgi:hypothetical protein